VIIKPGRCNIGTDHLPILESREIGGVFNDQLLDADLFQFNAIPEYLEDITVFLSTQSFPEMYYATHKRHMVVREEEYQLITRKLYNLGLDTILMRCVLYHEIKDILWECHNGVAGGHVEGKAIAQKVLYDGLLWATLFKDAKAYARSCDVFQRVGKTSQRDEFPFRQVRALQTFEKWVVDFIGPINPTTKNSKVRYIFTATDYLTCWVESYTSKLLTSIVSQVSSLQVL
jgi:hypothetical protein